MIAAWRRQQMKNSLCRDCILRRGEFGAVYNPGGQGQSFPE